MRWTTLDGALMGFARETGLNVLLAGDGTRALGRSAPRSLQVGLLTPCNMACSFCYRDTSAPSLLTRPYLVDLLQRAEQWGVLEVAFGGGEPLLFKGFADMIDELHRTTSLGLDFTTNGLLLTRELAERLTGKVGEIRLSAYPDNDWRGTLSRLRGASIGINWIVTPRNVGEVVEHVTEFVALGARNVLLLGYKGADASMLLDRPSLDSLRNQLETLEGWPLRVDICLYPHLADLPHLFPRVDCGAGDDMLAITADRAVQACSFADRRIPFETFEELQQIYALMKVARPHANTGGCTRDAFPREPPERVVSGRVLPILPERGATRLFAWTAHASSNSGPYTLLARFRTEADAKRLEGELDDAYQAHLDWVVENQEPFMAAYYAPTPPLVALGKDHGFAWPKDDGFAWEGDAFGDRAEADALEIERFGTNVIVHVPYGQNIGAAGIEHICADLGAESVVPIEAPFLVVIRPKDAAAEQELARAFDEAEDLEGIAFDGAARQEVPFDECDYRVEGQLSGGARQLGFLDTIGGYMDAARFILDVAGFKNVEFDLQGGRAPRRVAGAAAPPNSTPRN